MKGNKKIFLPAVFIFLVFSGSRNYPDINNKFIVCYYSSYNKSFYTHLDIDYKKLTHICHAFIWPDSIGNLIYNNDFLYPELIENAHKHGVKVLISLGGWGRDSGFMNTASDSVSRNNFTNQLVEFCTSNKYDGADLDWEYPSGRDNKNFIKLVKDLREAFNNAGIELLTAALPSFDFRNGYDINELNKFLDWFGIMTYDFHGSWSDHSGHNSPIYSSPLDSCGSIDQSVNYYLAKGIPRDKLLIGIPLYGRTFNTSVLYMKNSGGEASLYHNSNYKILEDGWKYSWDDVCQAPILTNPENSQLVSYDDLNSIRLKSQYIFEGGYKGAIVWALSQDYDGNTTPLLNSLGDNLLNPATEPPSVPFILPARFTMKEVVLRWNPSKNAWKYELELAGDSLFLEIKERAEDIRKFSFNTNGLEPGNKYYWRVRSKNYIGTSNWSATDIIDFK
jgi:chitinase